MKTSAHKVWIPPEKISGDKAHIMNNQKPEKWQQKQQPLGVSSWTMRITRWLMRLPSITTTKFKRLGKCLWSIFRRQRTEGQECARTTRTNRRPKESILIAIILLLLMINVVPPTFSVGKWAPWYFEKYFDNVYFTLVYFMFSFLSAMIPVLYRDMKLVFIILCAGLTGWNIAILAYEILNFWTPDIVLNTYKESDMYLIFLSTLLIGILITLIHTVWMRPRNL